MMNNIPGYASAEALRIVQEEAARKAYLALRQRPKGPGIAIKPTVTKTIFAGWANGQPHMTRQKVRRGGKTEIHMVQVPTRRAVYTFDGKAAAAQRALYGRATNFKGEVAR